jgi:hypothetical protein
MGDTAPIVPRASVPTSPHLFSELRVGSVILESGIVSPGHDTVMAEGGRVPDRLVACQQRRAEGGVGLIVLPSASQQCLRLQPHAHGPRRLVHPRVRQGCEPSRHTDAASSASSSIQDERLWSGKTAPPRPRRRASLRGSATGPNLGRHLRNPAAHRANHIIKRGVASLLR